MNKNRLIRLLKTLLEEELSQENRMLVYGEVELISSYDGLAVRLDDGKELHIKVK